MRRFTQVLSHGCAQMVENDTGFYVSYCDAAELIQQIADLKIILGRTIPYLQFINGRNPGQVPDDLWKQIDAILPATIPGETTETKL